MATAFGTDGLWAITAYFNPMHYRYRRNNYRIFRERLGIPLVTAEFSHDSIFELEDCDADLLVRLSRGDVMWQKERLLNVALAALPAECKKIAWFDCDVYFMEPDWAERASKLLDRYALVQLFRDVHYMPRDRSDTSASAAELSRQSVGHAIASGIPRRDFLGQPFAVRQGTFAGGHAWGAQRALFDKHGFYDACIIGGGPRAINCACHGEFDLMGPVNFMNPRQEEHYYAWAKSFHADAREDMSCLDATIFHLWHGELRNRGQQSRYAGLAEFAFDPFQDIALDPGGLWRWNSDKPKMHQFLRDYFASRKEDG